MKAVLYARVSREEQAEGYSIAAQLEAMRRFCVDRGWTVAGEYVEPGFTARTDKRPVFTQALAACERGEADVLLTHKMDRAFRSLLDQLQRLAQLDGLGVAYVSVVEQIDYSTPHGRMFMQMLGALNEWYSRNLAEEVRKGKRGRARAGLSNATIPAFGYSRDPGGVDEPDPAQVGTVRRLFDLYASGSYTLQAVADQLNAEGRPAGPRSRTGRWTSDAVSIALANRSYLGEVRYRDDWYPGQHEPIIAAKLFDQAQQVRRRHLRHQTRKTSHQSLLQGLLVCVHCGGKLWVSVSSDGRWAYYWDPAARRGIECSASTVYIPQSDLDDQVEALVSAMRLPDDWRIGLVELAHETDERRDVERKRRLVKDKLGRLVGLHVDGEISRGEYDKRKAGLLAELDALVVPQVPDLEEAAAALETIGQAWTGATFVTRRTILRNLFDVIHVDPLARQVVGVTPIGPFGVLMRQLGWEETNGIFQVGSSRAAPAGAAAAGAGGGQREAGTASV